MPDRSDIVYYYDGSYEGMLCCIFESFDKKEYPLRIDAEKQPQMSIFPSRWIETDLEKAERVKAGIRKTMSEDAYQMIALGYHACVPERERLILNFVRIGMKAGRKVLFMLTDTTVADLHKAVKHLTGEAHQLKGFVRFSVYDSVLVAVIEPKNDVLPLLVPHFCDRYANDPFLIIDKAHGSMLAYRPFEHVILPIEDFELPEPGEEERYYQSLWKTFFLSIAIEGRESRRRQMSHMQKRYWSHLTEMNPKVATKREGGRLPAFDPNRRQLEQRIELEGS